MRSSTSGATEVQIVPPHVARSATGDTIAVSICFTRPQSTMRQSTRTPTEKPRDLLERPLCGRQADALRRTPDEVLEPLEREREMRAALRSGDRVDLVDDHGAQRAEHAAARAGS